MLECMPYKNKEVQRAYCNAWIKKRRRLWILANGPCVDCGLWFGLEVHHRDPLQKIDHKVWSWSEARRTKELAKCEVKCQNCHVEWHRKYVITPLVHGTLSGYKTHSCHCNLCRKANADWKRRYTKARKGKK